MLSIGGRRVVAKSCCVCAFAGFAVGFSKMSDIFGRKSVIIVAWLLFTLGSVWCGFAREMTQLYA